MTQNVVSLSAVRRSRRMGQDLQAAVSAPDLSPRALRSLAQANSDEELLRLIARGQQSAMNTLYRRHSVRVFRFALSMTRDRSLAERVVSDVFFDVWRRPGSFEGKSQVSTWLLAITRHKALSLLRRPADESLTDEFAESIEDTADDPEAAIGRKQTSTTLSHCLLKLSAMHREIIDLVYYHEKSIDEVAEILQIPRSTVKTRMFYAREHLAQLLAASGNTAPSMLL